MNAATISRHVHGLLGCMALLVASLADAGQSTSKINNQECAAIFSAGLVSGGSGMSNKPGPKIPPKPPSAINLGDYVQDAQSASSPLVGIAFDKSKATYTLYAKNGTFNFGSSDINMLATKLLEQTESGETFYWIPDGFESPAKIEAFAASLRVQLAQGDPQRRMRNIETISEGTSATGAAKYASGSDLPRAYFQKGATTKEAKKSPITEGTYKDWYRVVIQFVVHAQGKIQTLAIAVLVKTEQIAEEVLSRVNAMRANPKEGLSAAAIVAGIERELRATHPELKEHELDIVLQEEFARNYLVEQSGRRPLAG